MGKFKAWDYEYEARGKGTGKCLAFTLNGLAIYMSYDTVVAFRKDGELTISKNVWSRTTGKHLNYIDDDKSKRVDYDVFKNKFYEAITDNDIHIGKEIMNGMLESIEDMLTELEAGVADFGSIYMRLIDMHKKMNSAYMEWSD